MAGGLDQGCLVPLVGLGPILQKLWRDFFFFLFLIVSITFTELFKSGINSEFQVTEGIHTEIRLLLGGDFISKI